MKVYKYPKIKDKRNVIKFWKEKRSYQNNMTFAFIQEYKGSNVSIVYNGKDLYYQSKNEIINSKKDQSGFVDFCKSKNNQLEYSLKLLYNECYNEFENLEAVAIRGKFTTDNVFVIYDFAFYFGVDQSCYRIYNKFESLFDNDVKINLPYSFKSYQKKYANSIKSPKTNEQMLVKALKNYTKEYYEYYDAPLWFKC